MMDIDKAVLEIEDAIDHKRYDDLKSVASKFDENAELFISVLIDKLEEKDRIIKRLRGGQR